MAYKIFENDTIDVNTSQQSNSTKFSANGQDRIDLPQEDIIQNAEISRDGVDLVLETDNSSIIIEGYFEASPAPDLVGPDGMHLTPQLVESFMRGGNEYADAGLQTNDASPVGAIQEISGEATVTRLNGTVETIGIGTPIYQGDIVETDESGAVNIMFIDETSFAVSEDARLSIDEYVFDPASQSGTSNFSVLKGVFVFTSGLIGRDNPDDVMIDTPSGSIGIRGTIIAGDVNTGEITVIEGAIVLHDFSGNSVTLANQFETARFNSAGGTIENIGELGASDVASKFMSVSTVAADLFSSIEDAANDDNKGQEAQSNDTGEQQESEAQEETQEQKEAPAEDTQNDTETQNAETVSEEDNTSDSEGEGEDEGETEMITQESEPEQQENKENTQASASESETTEIITSEDIASPEFKALNKTVNNIAETNQNDEPNQVNNNITPPTNAPPRSDETQAPPETITVPDRAVQQTDFMPDEFFSGSTNSEFTYNFSQEFFDPDATITGYQLTSPSGSIAHPDVNAGTVNFDPNTGQLDFTLDSVITANSGFNFTVTALSTTGNISKTISFDVMQPLTSNNVISNTGDVYTGNDASIITNADDVSVYADTNNTANTINIGGNNNIVKSGDGDDTINVNGATAFQIFAGTGHDEFSLESAGNIDFSNSNTLIREIEHLEFDNSQTNDITLRYSDIVRMTDSDNRLEINLDNNDTLNIVNNTGNNFSSAGQETIGGDVFDVFTDGHVTLLIDATEGTVTGL